MHEHAQLLPKLSKECQVRPAQIQAVLALLQSSNTVPFIARYRKEATGGLDEVVIRNIQERFTYGVELLNRQKVILESIASQGKLTEELRAQIQKCEGKSELEDLYMPYKPKRRTRAMIAREKGLESLAMRILEQPLVANLEEEAGKYICLEKEVADSKEALRGARDIIAEIMAQNAEWRAFARKIFITQGQIRSNKREDILIPTKFEQYYDYSESLSQILSHTHRYLAIARGERENILRMSFCVPNEVILEEARRIFLLNLKSPFAHELNLALEDSYQRLLLPSLESDICVELKIKSDKQAIDIFAHNLRTILLSAPLGGHTVIGIDPGLRTGCKCAVIDSSGKFVDHALINLVNNNTERASATLVALIKKYNPVAIGIGNGTGGRETQAFVRKILGQDFKNIYIVSVSESGASVYSASEIAREEISRA